MKKIFTVRCPCCNNLIKIEAINGKFTVGFFNAENNTEIYENLSKLGYEFGEIGGEINK